MKVNTQESAANIQNAAHNVKTGTVVSMSSAQTVIVQVQKVRRHPVYGKAVRRSKRYAVHHTGEFEVRKGDAVQIREVRPISKTKHMVIVKKLS